MGGPIGTAAAAAAPGAQEEVACLGGPRAADCMGGVSCTNFLGVLVTRAGCMRLLVACSLPLQTICMEQKQPGFCREAQQQLSYAAEHLRAPILPTLPPSQPPCSFLAGNGPDRLLLWRVVPGRPQGLRHATLKRRYCGDECVVLCCAMRSCAGPFGTRWLQYGIPGIAAPHPGT